MLALQRESAGEREGVQTIGVRPPSIHHPTVGCGEMGVDLGDHIGTGDQEHVFMTPMTIIGGDGTPSHTQNCMITSHHGFMLLRAAPAARIQVMGL